MLGMLLVLTCIVAGGFLAADRAANHDNSIIAELVTATTAVSRAGVGSDVQRAAKRIIGNLLLYVIAGLGAVFLIGWAF